MSKGWIKLHRSLLDSDIWQRDNQPFDMRSAWIDLLMLANHEDKKIIFDYKPVTVDRGQFITSVRKLGERWKWGKERTLKYLRLLERLGMITKDSNTHRTLVTIVNYDKYQDLQDTGEDTIEDTGRYTGRTQPEHGSATNKNDKNEKKNIYLVQFEEFWKIYPRHEDKARAYQCYRARLNAGYSEDELLTACKNYAEYCKREGKEKRYIKLATTFLSINEPFKDYLSADCLNGAGETKQKKNSFVNERKIDFSELEKEVFTGE